MRTGDENYMDIEGTARKLDGHSVWLPTLAEVLKGTEFELDVDG